MSNVEIIRRAYEAFEQGQLDSVVELWDLDARFVPAMAGAVEDKVYRGPAGLRRYVDELFESFSEVGMDEREFRDFGDRVLVLYHLSVRGRDSGVSIDQPGAALYELRDGKVVHGRSYLSQREALEAVGLSAHDVHADS
jgi:ketosteroid isomerase-like protein